MRSPRADAGLSRCAVRLGRWLAAMLGAAAALCVFVAVAAPASRTLVVGSEEDYPPFATGTTDATAGGFTVDLWAAVAKDQGLTYTIRVRRFDELLQAFKAGDIDVLLNLAKSDERRQFADFSATHVVVGGAIFVRRGEARIRVEDDLAGKSVIVIKSDLAHDHALAKGWQAGLVLVDTAEEGLLRLASGQHDAMLISRIAGLQTIRNQRIDGLVALDARVGFSQRFAFAVRKGDAELLTRINEGLALTRTNGVYDRLYDRWFGAFEDKPLRLRDVWPALAVVALIASVGWTIQMRNRRRRDLVAAAALRESEERWKFALDGAGDGVWDADLIAGTTLYSRRWKEILGYADGEIGSAADEWSGRIHPEDLPRVLQENQRCLDGAAESFVSEFRMRAKDGHWVWILDRGKVVRRSSDGRALRMIGTHTDISARKARDARDAVRERALRESEERLQRALDASLLALWDLDLGSGRVYLSDAWSEMLGGPREATTTTFEALTALVPDEDRPRIAAAMGDTLRGLTPGYVVEHRVRRPDGQSLWIVSRGRVVERAPDGRALRAVGTNLDITERKRAEATQRVLESQLREAQKLEAIGTLAGGIAHDFNNIMAAILGNLAFARQDLARDHTAQVYLEQIQKAGQRARSLVQQILAFSRQQPSEFLRLALRPVVEETLTMLRSVVDASVELRSILPERDLAVMANPTQLQQVLMNLGTNAYQALPNGVGEIEIGFEAVVLGAAGAAPWTAGMAPGEYAHLWVRDDGCGMDDDTRVRIFEPFFTTKPVGQGTGLGLAVVHGIVEAHRGSIGVESAVGRGSTFHLHLPLVDCQSLPAPLEIDRGDARRGRGQHVLYIDDDEVMALMVHGLLQRLGYRATCTLDAREGIALVERDPAAVDLVVTDFNMPNVSGLDVVRALARIRPGLPVAISSGYVSDELRESASDLGVRGVMQKEHTLEELGALVHAALGEPDRLDAAR